MNEPAQSTVAMPIAKVVSLWAAVGLTTWADWAAAAAFLYSILLIADFFWRKWGRPFCEDRGWIKRLKRRADDTWPR